MNTDTNSDELGPVFWLGIALILSMALNALFAIGLMSARHGRPVMDGSRAYQMNITNYYLDGGLIDHKVIDDSETPMSDVEP
jgi:hypothetical protein